MIVLENQLKQLQKDNTHLILRDAAHGIEKEGLRVDYSGTLSQKPHPEKLGSPLTNSNITTDFSESLLELITPVFHEPGAAIQSLEDLHCYTYSCLDNEMIWTASLPCRIPDPGLIPIARYGSSNIGQLKHIYRLGLMHRYGTMMQSIAGIHYNFSLPDTFWQNFQIRQRNADQLQKFQSAAYFKMIRNFRRHSWLLLFLFGASPALDDSFLKARPHNLQLRNEHTLYLPYATSLRMSDLGYSTNEQASLNICFNHLNTYIKSLVGAVQTPHPRYEQIGIKVAGEYRQLNDTLLQIENEHYSDVRPKRVCKDDERPLEALQQRGVEYIEIRNTDINPFLPVGIDAQQALFLDAFLISCLLMDDHVLCPKECRMVSENTRKVVVNGREPGLLLNTPAGESPLTELGGSLLAAIQLTGELLDEIHQTKAYTQAVHAQQQKLEDPAKTPSAQVLAALDETGLEYTEWVLQKSREHKDEFKRNAERSDIFENLSRRAAGSIIEQQQLEMENASNFDDFLRNYLAIDMIG